MFFQKEIETMPREDIKLLQQARLRQTLRRVYDRVPLYRERFEALKLRPEDIRTAEDLQELPFTVKDDLRKNYPFGTFAADKKDIVRIHASSGTTGKPTVVGYTRNDLDVWSDLVARLAMATGVTKEDTVQISFGYGLFTGAFGLHQGLEKIGCAVIPMSSGNTEKQLMLMQDFEPTVLVATPSYAVYLSEAIAEQGIADKIKIKIGLFGAEGCTTEMRQIIEKNMNILATDNYGMSELIGPGVAGECYLRKGMHLAEDHFIAEIIDPETGRVLPEGEFGELVITSLTKEAFPIIRYRTRDITRLVTAPCECGRTHARIDKIRGRSDDMLIIKGVNVFPSQVESVLVSLGDIGIAPHYQLVLRKKGVMDALEVVVELLDGSMLESFTALESIQTTIHEKLRSVLGLDCKVTLVSPKTIERSTGKAKRVIDLRNEKK